MIINRYLLMIVVTVFALVTSATSSSKAATPSVVSPDKSEISFQDFQSLETFNYDFGYWPVGSTSYRDLYFVNNGAWSIGVERMSVWGPSFSAIHHCPPKLDSGYRCLVRVFFQPMIGGLSEGQLLINTDRGQVQVYMNGWGY